MAWPVYADTSALAQLVGNPTGQDDRLSLALIMGSRWVDRTVGYNAGAKGEPIDTTPIEDPVTLDVIPVDIGIRNASLVAAARFLRSGDVPLGIVSGMGDLGMRVKADIPEASLHLRGLVEGFGVA